MTTEQRHAYDSPTQRQRWLSVVNRSDEQIPGFALLRLDRIINTHISQELLDGQAVYKVYKPDSDSEAMQNPAMLLVNGPTPIPPGKYGKATQDWPATVLHDGKEDGLPNGFPCGPKADSWYVWSGGAAFTAQTHDIARPVTAPADGVHTVWIGLGNGKNQGSQIGVTGGGTGVAVNDFIPLFGTQIADGAEINSGGDGVKITKAGIWFVSASATLSSTTAPRGSHLRMSLYKNTTWTGFLGYRLQDIEEGEYGDEELTTAENVCFPAILDLEVDDELKLKNDGGYETDYGSAILVAHKLSSPFETSSGTLTYPPT